MLGRGGLKPTARYYLVRAHFYQIASLQSNAMQSNAPDGGGACDSRTAEGLSSSAPSATTSTFAAPASVVLQQAQAQAKAALRIHPYLQGVFFDWSYPEKF